jgi:nitrite reductase (NADH) small subunit
MTRWTPVCRIEEIPRLGARVMRGGHAGRVAVFRTAEDRVFALDDRCPHRGGPLSQGIVHGTRVACPLHNWTMELDSGEAVSPDQGCVRTYPVNVEQGMVYVALAEHVHG